VTEAVARFASPPAPGEAPTTMPSPFAQGAPHPLARRAADELTAALRAGTLAAGHDFSAADHGKMFGVLVVADRDGGLGYLRAFSGMVAGRWHVDGFVPPLFDEAARDAFWPAGEAELAAIDAALAATPAVSARRAALAELDAHHAAAVDALDADHRSRRAARHAARAALGVGDPALAALAQASRADTTARRRLDAAHAAARAPLAAACADDDAAAAALRARRTARSRALLTQIHDTYVVTSARGERRPLRALFAPDPPPGGAGDCAAPKLLAEAYRRGLRPLALAEVWWGAPPATGGRRAGAFYPACRGKCGPLLPFMLDGVEVEAAPIFGADPLGPDEPRVVFEDAWLIVVDKPAGMLSVPGRSGALRDSAQTRLRARAPDAHVVHRLDLDTSGLLLATRDAATCAVLQQQFARREVAKRYVAWLDGEVTGERGVIELALRGDLDDRPRQIVDAVHGKAARTTWQVLARVGGQTLVALWPHTGRTHQLRVHAAHHDGLGAPIVGDPLYGRAADRLKLHAEELAFDHPHTGARIELRSPAPF
jgi:tRNA pseudouridine32 synthase/23S rRNA pseudouridine746 synthase